MSCGETQCDLINKYINENKVSTCQQQIIKRHGHSYTTYIETKTIKIFSIDEKLKMEDEYDNEGRDDEYSFNAISDTLSEIVSQIKSKVDRFSFVAVDLAMDESPHCFVISKIDGEYYLEHGYIGEFSYKKDLFSFERFEELLMLGREKRWQELFGVSDDSYKCGEVWEMHITTIKGESSPL